jgi:predicted esterase
MFIKKNIVVLFVLLVRCSSTNEIPTADDENASEHVSEVTRSSLDGLHEEARSIDSELSSKVADSDPGIISDFFGMFGKKEKSSGLIFLHGLATPGVLTSMMKLVTGPGLGLSMSRNKISTPKAPHQAIAPLPKKFRDMIPSVVSPRSWFNFWLMPAVSVLSPIAGESKEELEEAMKWVEAEIEAMIQEGIPQENIVVSGASQGGALTLYTALHTKYKIGGFMGFVTWAPLLKVEPPTSLPEPVNKDTPIFHMNGLIDPIVPIICGSKTSAAFSQVFSRYEQKNVPGTHLTSINPLTIPKINRWLRRNVPGMAFSKMNPINWIPA